jgi:hypothetical protein
MKVALLSTSIIKKKVLVVYVLTPVHNETNIGR